MADRDVLQVAGIEAGYGKIQVLWGAELSVRERETVVLLGANGSGKTTLLKVLIGLVPAWKGTVKLLGHDLSAARSDRRVRAGMAYMSEMGCFPGLTIDENIRIGGHLAPAPALKTSMAELYEIFPALASRRGALASSLSGGQRKMLGIAKALAGNPRLVVMDEPSSGLSPLLVKEVINVLDRCRGRGLSLLIAEQNVNFLKLADRVYTLDRGRIGFEGSVEEMHADGALRRAYFGLA